MSHLLRTLALFSRRPWRRQLPPLERFTSHFRVMPWDCDLNIHLTNTRYPAWLDLARTDFFLRIGAMGLFVRHGWRSVLASQTLTFIREIPPLARVDIESRVLYWDQKYFYMEHRFLVKGRLHAKALARIAVLKKGRVCSLGAMLSDMNGELPQPPAVPAEVTAKIGLLGAKRDAEQRS
ncbi:MAG: thioesterase family protein [Pseudomonadota bacterium]|nr:thioesterase family protein [Pseudomonadota bacterium]